MAFSATVGYTISGSGILTLTDAATVTSGVGSVTQLDETIPANSTDLNIVVAIDVSALKFLYITANATMTLETNSGSAPDDTLTVASGAPIVWTNSSGLTSPLDTDVTSIKVTSVAGGRLQMAIGQDSTP